MCDFCSWSVSLVSARVLCTQHFPASVNEANNVVVGVTCVRMVLLVALGGLPCTSQDGSCVCPRFFFSVQVLHS